MAALQETIATFIRAYHRTVDDRAGPNTTHHGEAAAAAAIIDFLKSNPEHLFGADMFWDAGSPEQPVDDLADVRDNTGYGEITEVWRGLRLPTIFVAWAAPRDDSDEPVYIQADSLAEAQRLINVELASRES
jgi:hypothetical protein